MKASKLVFEPPTQRDHFGVGFRAVYHLIHVPSVLTANDLLGNSAAYLIHSQRSQRSPTCFRANQRASKRTPLCIPPKYSATSTMRYSATRKPWFRIDGSIHGFTRRSHVVAYLLRNSTNSAIIARIQRTVRITACREANTPVLHPIPAIGLAEARLRQHVRRCRRSLTKLRSNHQLSLSLSVSGLLQETRLAHPSGSHWTKDRNTDTNG